MTGTASTPSRAACFAPSAIHRETEADPSFPAAVGSCTYFGDRPAISAASSSSIAGRYSPLPTSATGPGLATLVRIRAGGGKPSPASDRPTPLDGRTGSCSPRRRCHGDQYHAPPPAWTVLNDAEGWITGRP